MDVKSCLRVPRIFETACRDATANEADHWIAWCNHYITLYRKLLRKGDLSVGEKHRLQATILSIYPTCEKFRLKKQQRHGGGIGNASRLRITERVRWQDMESVFNNRIRTGAIINLQQKDLKPFLRDARTLAVTRLKDALITEGNLKVNCVLAAKFQILKDGESIEETKYFNTKNQVILPATNIKKWFSKDLTEQLLEKVEDFQERDSGWSLKEIIYLMININRYVPLIAGGLNTYVPLPKKILSKKAVVNVRNSDEFCFLWSIVAALYRVTHHTDRVNSYPHYSKAILPDKRTQLTYTGIDFPMKLRDIPKFERMNKLSINVYGIQNNNNGPTVVG